MNCPSCGTENRHDARFCAKCGQALAAEPAATAATTGAAPAGSKGMSIASLVLGIMALVLLGFLSGIPAIILGAIALARKRPGKRMAIAGLVTGSVGTLLTTIGVILALTIPNFVLFQERTRRSSVKNNMHMVQTVLEAYSTDHNGNYPGADVSWESDDEGGIALWFPGGDPIGIDGEGIVGSFPVNPYTGERYEYGTDLFYFPDTLQEPGVNGRKRGEDEDCPYRGLAAPPGAIPGTIVVLCYTPEGSDIEAPVEYGIVGYGRDLDQPMYDLDLYSTAERGDRNNPDYFVYFVLHN